MKVVWILLACGVIAAGVIIAFLGLPKNPPEPVVERLKWTDPISTLSVDEFYGTLRRSSVNVEREGADITIAGGCADKIDRFRPSIPNGARVTCREHNRTAWLLDKR